MLTAVRPRGGMRLAASRPAVYLELLENIQVHGFHLMRDRGRILARAEIAADWYDRIYSPAIRAIQRDRLGRDYRHAPDADLFLMLHEQRREGFPSSGCPSLEETARLARGEVMKTSRPGRGRGL